GCTSLRAIVRSAPCSDSASVLDATPSNRTRSRSWNGRTVATTRRAVFPEGKAAVRELPGANRSGASLYGSTTTSPPRPCAFAMIPTRIGGSPPDSVGNLERGAAPLRRGRRREEEAHGLRRSPLAADHLAQISGHDPEGEHGGLSGIVLVDVHALGVIDQPPGAIFDEGFHGVISL